MNIFAIDPDPNRCAKHMRDKHVIKMILESAQMLSTTRRYYGDNSTILYKSSHINHPCSIWVRQSLSNYIWLAKHFKALCLEYQYRYLKIHKSQSLIMAFGEELADLPNIGLTPFVKIMIEKYKQDDTIESYRNFYIAEKIKNKYWTRRTRQEIDSWLSDHILDSQFKSHKKFTLNKI